MPPEAVLANTEAARTPTGEIKDQTPVETKQETNSSSETKTEPEAKPALAESKPATTGDKSVLNQDDKTAPKKEEAPVVPEKYELKAPEGFTLDEAMTAEASVLFKEDGLTQERAQKYVDFYAAKSKASIEAAMNSSFEAMKTTRKGWADEIKSDPVLGGRLGQVRENLGRALDTLGDAKLANEFREAMDFTGAGDHPAFVRVINKWAEMLTEGKVVRGPGPVPPKAPGAKQPSAAQALYPNLP